MKKYILLLFLLTYSFFVFAQDGKNGTRISLFYEQIRNFRQPSNYQTGGVQLEFYVVEEGWCSIGYQLALGKNAQNNFMLHLPLGWYLAQYPLQFSGTSHDNWWIWAAIICLALPENINFHFKLSDNFYVSPYFAPAGIDFWQDAGYNTWQPTIAAGIRLNVLKDSKWSLSPFLGVKTHYNTMNWNQVQFGTMIGIGF
jgi:hypothetical protein